MKTMVFDIKPGQGDLIIVEYTGPRGGCTNVKHTATPDDTSKTVAADLASQINKEWLPEMFEARANDAGALIVHCSDAAPGLTFKAFYEGHGGTKITQTEF